MFTAKVFLIAKKWKQFKYPSINESQYVVYPYNGILFGNKKKLSTDI